MEAADVYAIALGSVFILFLTWHVAALTSNIRSRLIGQFLKYFFETLPATRWAGTTDVSIGACAGLVALIVGNISASLVGLPDRAEFARRLGLVSIINLVLLYVGGRTSFVFDLGLGVPLHSYQTMHRWIGRLSLLEAIAHSTYYLASVRPLKWLTVSLLPIACSILLSSFVFVRRRLYEAFLKLHLGLALAFQALLWIHISQKVSIATVCFAIASGAWLVQTSGWLFQIVYRNAGRGNEYNATIVPFSSNCTGVDGVSLKIKLRRPWRVRAGQYVYINIISSDYFWSRFQSHPYLIAWSDAAAGTITLLIESKKGFSNVIRLCQSPVKVVVDGPYGQSLGLGVFDKTLFMANGTGVAAHLLAIRQLLQAHEDRTARVRRITLVWLVEFAGQELWAKSMLEFLLRMDKRRILTVLVYLPLSHSSGSDIPQITEPDQIIPRLFRIRDRLDPTWVINMEWSAEAGNMAISLCGTPSFEARVRTALRAVKKDVRLFSSPFQMDETHASSRKGEQYMYPQNA